MANENYIKRLQDAILKLHGTPATHAGTMPVTETFRGQTVWNGIVEVFNIEGDARTKRCYAWSVDEPGQQERFVAVLELPPVDSAQTAVRAAIVAEAKAGKRN